MPDFKSLNNSKLVELIKGGAVGVIPTDTIYGLVAEARNQTAVKELYSLKSRDTKPGTIIAASIDQLVELGLNRRYLKVVEQYWPGAVSVVIPAEASLDYLHLGKLSLAVRIPSNQGLIDLLKKTGPLVTTSANHPGEKPANTMNEAKACFKEGVAFYVDGGNLSNHEPSTVIRIVDDAVEVIRKGAVTIDEESGEIVS